MDIKYNEQPTLLIGLGGFGSRIVDNVCSRIKEKNTTVPFCIDTDINDSRILKHIPKNNIINIASSGTVITLLNTLKGAKEWFPMNPLLYQKTITEGSGQVRAVSRLAFEDSLLRNHFQRLLDSTYKLALDCFKNNYDMRVSIVTSLTGGTGAGIFIQVALMIRKFISKSFPTLNVTIQGDFILPANFLFCPFYSERRNMENITYSSLMELNAINECLLNNIPTLEFNFDFENNNTIDCLPYDYCFLYDKVGKGAIFDSGYIENAMIERLYSNTANTLNDAFVDGLKTYVNKTAGNIYGTINCEVISADADIFDSSIYLSIINRTNNKNGNSIITITSPDKLNLDSAQIPKDTVLIEIIDKEAENTTITELNYGIEISSMDKMQYGTGQYYLSYKNCIENLPNSISPHLHKNWHNVIAVIGADPIHHIEKNNNSKSNEIPKDSFVFISYSTKESAVAEQTRQVLEANKIPCWMAPQSIPAGSDYGAEIPKAIGKCKVLLLLLSQASQESNWVPKEVGLAIGKGKIIVPFQIDNSVISDSFNFYLTNSQRISAYNRMSDAYKDLTNRLLDLLADK